RPQRRPVDVRAARGGQPPQRDQDGGQGEDVPGPQQDAPHTATSPRTDWCQASARRSTDRAPTLMTSPSRPVTTIRAYMSGTACEACATAICCPNPGAPMTSSAVMVRISATAAASRTPVITYGSAVGHSTWRTRAQVPRPYDRAVSSATGSTSWTPYIT